MADHNREEMIEKAAHAILASAGIEPAEDGTYWGEGTWPNAVKDARIAFEVFEQAHTPAEDERDELAAWDIDAMIQGLRSAADSPKGQVAITRQRLVEAADAIEALAARRTVQCEPSDAAEGTGQPTNQTATGSPSGGPEPLEGT